MLNTEKRQIWIPALLILALLISIPVVLFRVAKARDVLTGADRRSVLGVYGEIRSRDGEILMAQDGLNQAPLLSDLVGGKGGENANTLYLQYAAELTPTISMITGVSGSSDQGNVMTTTLIGPTKQQKLWDAYQGGTGAVFAYDYTTGEILVALSVRAEENSIDDPSRVFSEVYVPGSTMKIVTSLLAAEQDTGYISGFSTVCGTEALSFQEGEAISCDQGPHGTQDYVAALGNSCNIGFGELVTKLDFAQVKDTLNRWGIGTDGILSSTRVGELSRMTSAMGVDDETNGHCIWGFCGQGDDQISLMDLAMIAGACANEGVSAAPYLVDSISGHVIREEQESGKTASGEGISYTDPAAANRVYDAWKEMTENYYRGEYRSIRPEITAAKTGTAQVGNGTVYDSLLLGVIQEQHIAFAVLVEDWTAKGIQAADVANILVDVVKE